MRAFVPALLLLLTACNPVLASVPLTTAAVGPMVYEVDPDPSTATVVFARGGAGILETDQATTLVTDDGEYLGQLRLESFAIAKVSPGKHVLVQGIPEAYGPDACGGAAVDLVAGQVYLISSASSMFGIMTPMPFADVPNAELSYYSRLVSDMKAGQANVDDRRDFWARCIQNAKQRSAVTGPEVQPQSEGRPTLSIARPK